MKINKIAIIFGVFLIILSYFLAISYNYNKFYFLLVFGLFICLFSLHKFIIGPIKKELFIIIYQRFLLMGVVGDLFGIFLGLWKYPNYNLVNYFLLYLITYPLAGFCMLYTFLILQKLFKLKIKAVKPNKSVVFSFLISGFVLLFFAIIFRSLFSFFLFASVIFFVLSIRDLLMIKQSNYSYLSEMIQNKKTYFVLFFTTAYLHAIIHEFPNVFAKEWIYFNFPLMNLTLFSIPISVLFFSWLILIIGPHAIYRKRTHI